MKKLLFIFLLAGAVGAAHHATAQSIGFYFYPDVNMYYNTHTREYSYENNGTWVHTRRLPKDRPVRGHEHVTVYGSGPEIWRENEAHKEKYKNWHHHDEHRDNRDEHYDRNDEHRRR